MASFNAIGGGGGGSSGSSGGGGGSCSTYSGMQSQVEEYIKQQAFMQQANSLQSNIYATNNAQIQMNRLGWETTSPQNLLLLLLDN